MDNGVDYWESLKDSSSQSLDIPAERIGISSGLGDVDAALKKNIFFGTSHLELGFMHGLGAKGSRLSNAMGTPEDFGKSEREDFRQLAKINEVELSVHVSPNAVPSVSGFDNRKGFSPEMREAIRNDVKMSVDFAADVARGGAVVLHLGEFPRAMQDISGKYPFRSLQDEAEEKKSKDYRVVDSRSGDIVASINEESAYHIPVQKKDSEGNLVFETSVTGAKLPIYDQDETGKLKVEEITFEKFKDVLHKGEYKNNEEAALNFVKTQVKHSVDSAAGNAEEYEQIYERSMDFIKKKKPEYEALKHIMESTPEKDKWKIKEQEMKFEQLEEEMHYYEKRARAGFQTAASQRGQEAKALETINKLQTITDYGKVQTKNNLADMAIYAYDKERSMGLEKPLFIAPENYQPDQYGGHPQEYKQIILDARDEMKLKLKARGMDDDEAKKVAEGHIKGTFDTGHANMWRKYFREKDPDGTKFNKWLVDQVGDLAKEGVIGHIHLTDNFGYGDEHINIGEGNTPIRELMSKLKEKGYKGDFIAEPGNQPQGQIHKVWTTALGVGESPIYSVDRTTRNWTNIEGSYFGRTQSPNYIVGDNRPSEEWTLWSGVQLE